MSIARIIEETNDIETLLATAVADPIDGAPVTGIDALLLEAEGWDEDDLIEEFCKADIGDLYDINVTPF